MTAQPQAPAGWATRAYVAARARLVTEHRPLDPQWVADYQAEVAAICAQSGLNPQGPLELTLVGLAAAPSEPEPFTSPVRGAGGPEAPGTPEYIPRHANGGRGARYAHWRTAGLDCGVCDCLHYEGARRRRASRQAVWLGCVLICAAFWWPLIRALTGR